MKKLWYYHFATCESVVIILAISERIRQLREREHWTQRELAAKLHIANSTLCQYESGARTPSDTVKKELANIFGVSIDYLLGASAIPTPASPADAATDLAAQSAADSEIKKAAAQLGRPLDETDIRLLELLKRATPEQKQAMLELLKQFQK